MTWYYAVDDDRRGPVDEGTLSTLIGSGVVTRSSLVWRQGMGDWRAAGATELARYFSGEPPPAPAAAPAPPPPVRPSASGRGHAASAYAPPSASAEPRGEPGAIEPRNVAVIIVLSFVTLGIYALYLLYRWAEEINRVSGRTRLNGTTALVVTLFTCGLGSLVFIPMYAFELEKTAAERGVPERQANLGMLVVGIEVGGFLLAIATAGVGLFITRPITMAFVQMELNKLAVRPVGGA
jgi:hypothetical protein